MLPLLGGGGGRVLGMVGFEFAFDPAGGGGGILTLGRSSFLGGVKRTQNDTCNIHAHT